MIIQVFLQDKTYTEQYMSVNLLYNTIRCLSESRHLRSFIEEHLCVITQKLLQVHAFHSNETDTYKWIQILLHLWHKSEPIELPHANMSVLNIFTRICHFLQSDLQEHTFDQLTLLRLFTTTTLQNVHCSGILCKPVQQTQQIFHLELDTRKSCHANLTDYLNEYFEKNCSDEYDYCSQCLNISKYEQTKHIQCNAKILIIFLLRDDDQHDMIRYDHELSMSKYQRHNTNVNYKLVSTLHVIHDYSFTLHSAECADHKSILITPYAHMLMYELI